MSIFAPAHAEEITDWTLDLLPELDGEQWQALLADIEADLEAFRGEEQVTAEQDLLAALFQQTFQERL